MSIPDPTTIDWTTLAGWAGGVATVLTSIGVAIWLAIQRAGKIAASLPEPPPAKIITADTVAMDRLAATIEASNTILTENNVLRREEHADRVALREALQANTEASDRCATAINDARTEIRELTREIVRSNR